MLLAGSGLFGLSGYAGKKWEQIESRGKHKGEN
jgi:hypothetical protein